VLPTLITLWLIVWVWNFLWNSLGRHIVTLISTTLATAKISPRTTDGRPTSLENYLYEVFPGWLVQLVGVVLAIVLVYFVGMLVGNFIGRTFWRLAEVGVMRVPIIRAIYPAVKQVTDFVLSDRKGQFSQSRVVAVRPHEDNIWSIGLVTGAGPRALHDATGEEMITVFLPSTPTAFSGYVLVVPRKSVIDLPLSVEEAFRMLISGGVIVPDKGTVERTVPIPQEVSV